MERLKFVGYSHSMLSHFSYEVSPKLMTNISVRYQFKKCTTVHLNKILIFFKNSVPHFNNRIKLFLFV